MKANRLQRVLLSVLLLGLAVPLFADSARGLVRRGNKAYGAGRYDEAMKAYEQADVERPESPVVMFNQGAVHYRAEDYVAARESFEKAAKASRDPAFEANCRYNVGDTWFKEARRQMDSDLKKAVEACERSVDNYQAALALRPELEAARRNIEIVRRLWKSILDEQKKRQEQQKAQQEEQQKFAEEMKQLIERQEKAAGQSAELGKKQESAGASQAVQDQSSVQAKDQRQLGQDTQAAADQLTQMLSQAPPPPAGGTPAGAPSPSHPAQEQMQQARQLQDQAASKLDQAQPKPASADQKQAAEALRKALESLSKPPEDPQPEGQKQDQKQDPQQDGQKQDQKGQEEQKQDQGKEGQKQDGQEQQKQDGEKQQQAAAKEGGKEPQDQDQKQVKARLADQDARNILDDEKRNRDRRTAAEQQGVAPVDKDW
jgi:hypothetical protein